MAAFIPIFIIEKVGRRPLMLFGVCNPKIYTERNISANMCLSRLACLSLWLYLRVPTIA